MFANLLWCWPSPVHVCGKFTSLGWSACSPLPSPGLDFYFTSLTNTNTKTHKHTNTHSSSIFLAIYFVLFFCKILSPVLRWGRVITRHVEGLLHPCNCHFNESQQIVNCWLSIVWACCTGGYCTHTDSLQPKNILRFFASWPSKYI